MKKKLSMGFIMAMAIMLVASVALAVAGIMYSPAASAVNQARAAIMNQYGLTPTTLGLFSYDLQMLPGQNVYTFRTFLDSEDANNAIGQYTVTLPEDGEITVSWTHDETDPAIRASGDLTAPVWGQPQLEKYLLQQAETEVIYHAFQMAASTPVPVADDSIVRITFREVEPGEQDIPRDEVIAIANAALMETFQLTEADMAQCILTHCTLTQVDTYDMRYWEVSYNYPMWNVMRLPRVMIDAATGEVTDISMQTID